ncbi:MAG: helix-turn-helix domain-containing protein [Gordonia polyisoprenivorans]|nr:helix-turn-helix domain-containing protein [Gordonia polyisoprenivorans]
MTTTPGPLTAEEPNYVTLDRAAELLLVNKRTIRRAIDDGTLRARKFGRAVRVETASIEEAFIPVER